MEQAAALGAILAGGRGSRLGGGKAAAALAGRPLAARVADALREAGVEAVLCAKPGAAVPGVDLPLVEEPEEPRHPAAGIVAALRAGRGRPVVAVACDLPLVSPSLLAALATAPDPFVVPLLGERLQPLCARYPASLLPALEAALETEEPLTRTVAALDPLLWDAAELGRHGDPERLLFNVNTPADLRRAEALLAA